MTSILALLFFMAYIFGDKSREKSRLEGIYYDLVLKYKNDPSKLPEIKAAGEAFGKLKGLDTDGIEKMISNDLA